LRYAMDTDGEQFFRGGRGGYFGRVLAAPLAFEPPRATVESGADGRFTFDHLGAGSYEVLATSVNGEGDARGAVAATLLVDGARVAADPVIATGNEVFEGRVVFGDRKPWTGAVQIDAARVGVIDFRSVASSGISVPADAQGRFRATGLAAGAYVVRVVDPGVFGACSTPVAVPHTGEYVLTLGAVPVVVTGRVVTQPEGRVVGGADIVSGGASGGIQLIVRATHADADGAFSIAMPLGREGGLFVNAPGFSPTMTQQSGTIGTAITVALVRGGHLVGRVLSDGGHTPVAGVRVTAKAARGGTFPPVSAESGPDGRFELENVPGGETRIEAAGAGWVARGAVEGARDGDHPNIVILPTGSSLEHDVVVVRAGRIAGVVLDSNGVAVAGAVVRAEPVMSPSEHAEPAVAGRPTATAPDGTFSFESLAVHSLYRLIASGPGSAEGRTSPTAAAAASLPEASRVEIRLPASRFVAVTVLDDATGRPVAGAGVHARSAAFDGGWETAGASMTGADGVARVGPLGAGAFVLSVVHERYVIVGGAQVSEPGSERAAVRLVHGEEIAGRVLLPSKEPAIGTRVRLEDWPSARPHGLEITDADGRFRFHGLPRAAYSVNVAIVGEGHIALTATARADAPAAAGAGELVLLLAKAEGSAKTVVVHVFGGDGGPVPRARLRVRTDHGSPSISTLAVNEGQAVIDLLGRDDALIGAFFEVRVPQSPTGEPLPWGSARVGPLAAGQTSIEVRLPPERAITGVLRGPDGKPVAGVRIVAAAAGEESEVESGEDNGLPQTRTDADGRYRIGNLGSEDVTLFVLAPPGSVAPAPVPVRGGQGGGQSTVDLVLTGGLAAAVTILDVAGTPMAGASVTASTRGPGGAVEGDARSATTDERGVARLRGLDRTKTFALSVEPRAGEFLPLRRDPWAPHDETIRVVRAYTVSGVVRDPAGKPLAGVLAMRKIGDAVWESGGTSDAAGAFTIQQVPAGDVTLRLTVRDDMPVPTAASGEPAAGESIGTVEVKTRADAHDLVVTLDPGAQLAVRLDSSQIESGHPREVAILSGTGGPLRDSPLRRSWMQSDGFARFRGLRAEDPVVIWVPPDAAGRSLLLRDVKPGDPELRLTPVTGGTISGTYAGPAGSTDFKISARAVGLPLSVEAALTTDGHYEIRGLPEGTKWTVSAHAMLGADALAGETDPVAPGATVIVDVKKR
jgi:hypothetical protein